MKRAMIRIIWLLATRTMPASGCTGTSWLFSMLLSLGALHALFIKVCQPDCLTTEPRLVSVSLRLVASCTLLQAVSSTNEVASRGAPGTRRARVHGPVV